MRRMLVLTMALAATAAAPVAAQLLAGMPAWNSPKGGTGLTLSADYGLPSNEARGGDAYGIRGSFGFSKFTVAAGYSGYDDDATPAERLSSFGAGAAFQLLGGALNPINVNLVGGVGTTGNVPSTLGEVDVTTYYAGAGASVNLPVPGFAIEPYLSVTNRWNSTSGNTESDIGWTLGANVGLGMFGLHVAYDSQDYGGTTGSIIGFGAHVSFGVPGM